MRTQNTFNTLVEGGAIGIGYAALVYILVEKIDNSVYPLMLQSDIAQLLSSIIISTILATVHVSLTARKIDKEINQSQLVQ